MNRKSSKITRFKLPVGELLGGKYEVAGLVGNRSLMEVANSIFRIATERMKSKPRSDFGKPDDLSFILYRPHRRSTSTIVQLNVN
jgi:hypothetical protein